MCIELLLQQTDMQPRKYNRLKDYSNATIRDIVERKRNVSYLYFPQH